MSDVYTVHVVYSNHYYSNYSYVHVLFIGVIDVGAEWASDLKEGVCPHHFTFDRDSCCWLSNDTFLEDGSCEHWHTWARLLGVDKPLDAYVVNFFIYVCFAVLFGSMAGLFVMAIAPYASGSGIPEVTVVLYVIYCLR